MTGIRPCTRAGVLLAALLLCGCVSQLERGEKLYRQGDLRGALSAWEAIPPANEDYERARGRTDVVGGELAQMLKRYEKRAQFFESEGRLGEAVLYFRLALKMDPGRSETLARVQSLVRELKEREQRERIELEKALAEASLHEANRHAESLVRLDPFDPAIQIEVRQVKLAAGGEVVRSLEAGKRAYASGDRAGAREAFDQVLALDKDNQTALGYLSYINRFEAIQAERDTAPMPPPPAPPRIISNEEILAEGHYRAAQEAEAAGDPFQALAEYAKALRVRPSHSEARAALQRMRLDMRPMVEELYAAGKRYFQDEDLHNALRSWRRVLLIDPSHQRSIENAARAERILSRLEELQTGGS